MQPARGDKRISLAQRGGADPGPAWRSVPSLLYTSPAQKIVQLFFFFSGRKMNVTLVRLIAVGEPRTRDYPSGHTHAQSVSSGGRGRASPQVIKALISRQGRQRHPSITHSSAPLLNANQLRMEAGSTLPLDVGAQQQHINPSAQV